MEHCESSAKSGSAHTNRAPQVFADKPHYVKLEVYGEVPGKMGSDLGRKEKSWEPDGVPSSSETMRARLTSLPL